MLMMKCRGMGAIKKMKLGGSVKGYELLEKDKKRKSEFESGSPFKTKAKGVVAIPKAKDIRDMKKGGSVKDACYRKVKAQYKVFPSAYASGAIAKCRKNRGK